MAKAAALLSLAAIVRSWLETLTLLDIASLIIQFVVVLYVAIPGWRRTRQKGFLCWNAGAFLGILNSVMAHTLIASRSTSPELYAVCRYGYGITVIVVAALFASGTVLIVRSYLVLHRQVHGKATAQEESDTDDWMP
jgi:hypothetical protein